MELLIKKWIKYSNKKKSSPCWCHCVTLYCFLTIPPFFPINHPFALQELTHELLFYLFDIDVKSKVTAVLFFFDESPSQKIMSHLSGNEKKEIGRSYTGSASTILTIYYQKSPSDVVQMRVQVGLHPLLICHFCTSTCKQ